MQSLMFSPRFPSPSSFFKACTYFFPSLFHAFLFGLFQILNHLWVCDTSLQYNEPGQGGSVSHNPPIHSTLTSYHANVACCLRTRNPVPAVCLSLVRYNKFIMHASHQAYGNKVLNQCWTLLLPQIISVSEIFHKRHWM